MEDLITKAEYKKYAGITSTNQDAKINILIPRISQFVKTYCKRTFVDFAFDYKVEVFNGDLDSFILNEPPILEVQSVELSTDYGQTYTELVEFTDWVLDGYQIKPITTEVFPKYIKGYKVTYRGGYEELPEDLHLACMDLVTYYLRNDGSVNAVKFTNTSSMQTEYISDSALPAYIRRILDYYILDYT